MDKKTKFKLELQGKEDRGYLEYWSVDNGDLTGIKEGDCYKTAQYVLGGRDGKFTVYDDYAVSEHSYYTLGEETCHSRLVDIVAGKVEGKYYDPEFAAKDDILRLRRNARDRTGK